MSLGAEAFLRKAFLPFLALVGCSVDTQLGLEVTLDAATVTVTNDGSADVVDARLDVTYRAGMYSQSSSAFRPESIQLYTGGELLFDARAVTPPTFQPSVAPGQSRMAVLTASGAAVTSPRAVCGAEVEVLLVWRDVTTDAVGMSPGTATVACP